MKKVFRHIFIWSLVLCLCCGFLGTSALAADEDVTYVLAFRPGAYGSFKPGAEAYLSTYGNVQRSAAGNLFVEVKAGSGFPVGIADYIVSDDGNYLRGGLSDFPSIVTGDGDYVADYGILPIGSSTYRVLYVDQATGREVAEPTIAYAEAGTTITANAKNVTGYKVDAATKTITIGGTKTVTTETTTEVEEEPVVSSYTDEEGNKITETTYSDGSKDIITIHPDGSMSQKHIPGTSSSEGSASAGTSVTQPTTTTTQTVVGTNGNNEIIFYYTLQPNYQYGPNNVVVETAEVNGGETTEENAGTEAGETAGQGNEEQGAAAEDEGIETEDIGEDDVPMASGGEEVTVEDEDTPLAPGFAEDQGHIMSRTLTVLLWLAIGALLALIAFIFLRIRSRRKV